MNQQLFESVDQYISQLFHDEDDCLKATEESIIQSGIPQISVSPNQGKFLHILAKLCNVTVPSGWRGLYRETGNWLR